MRLRLLGPQYDIHCSAESAGSKPALAHSSMMLRSWASISRIRESHEQPRRFHAIAPSSRELLFGEAIEPGQGPSGADSWTSHLQARVLRHRKVLLAEQLAHQGEELGAIGDSQPSLSPLPYLSARFVQLPGQRFEQILLRWNHVLTSQATSRRPAIS